MSAGTRIGSQGSMLPASFCSLAATPCIYASYRSAQRVAALIAGGDRHGPCAGMRSCRRMVTSLCSNQTNHHSRAA